MPSAQSVSLNSRDAVGSRGVFGRHPDRAPGGQLAGAAGSGIDKLGVSTIGSHWWLVLGSSGRSCGSIRGKVVSSTDSQCRVVLCKSP